MKKITHILWQTSGSTANGIIGFVRVDNGFDIKTYCGYIETSVNEKEDAITIARYGSKTPFDITKISNKVNINYE